MEDHCLYRRLIYYKQQKIFFGNEKVIYKAVHDYGLVRSNDKFVCKTLKKKNYLQSNVHVQKCESKKTNKNNANSPVCSNNCSLNNLAIRRFRVNIFDTCSRNISLR